MTMPQIIPESARNRPHGSLVTNLHGIYSNLSVKRSVRRAFSIVMIAFTYDKYLFLNYWNGLKNNDWDRMELRV